MSALALAREAPVRRVLAGCASLATIAVVSIVAFLGREGLPVLGALPAGALLGERWSPASFEAPQFGILPLLTGSVLVTAVALIFSVPLAIGGAVYVSEFARPLEGTFIKQSVELLAGIPSVVLGFFGMVTLAPLVKTVFGLPSGLTALTGGLLLGLMALPTILTVAEDALSTVPRALKEASLALGASHWQTTWWVTVPAARSGLLGAVLLGLGRVIGETMAVMMVTGNAAVLTASPFESVRTVTATIAAEMGETAAGSDHFRVLFLLAFLLVVVTLALNLAARAALGGAAPGRAR